MARLLFASHDPSGANMLLPVLPMARARGHDVRVVGAGPAAAIFGQAGEDVMPDVSFDGATKPSLLVTGTAMGSFDRDLWRRARQANVQTFAVVDAWTSLKIRFERENGDLEEPGAVGVVDAPMADAVKEWSRARLYIVGQPHLQALERRLRGKRAGHKPCMPQRIVFFSECLREDGHKARYGIDQFDVAEVLFPVLAASGPLDFSLKPHPREVADGWPAFLAERSFAPLSIRIVDTPSEQLMMAADGVLGIFTMVLLEAALARIPILSVQPGRKQIVNTLLERLPGAPVVESAELPRAIKSFLIAAAEGRAPAPEGLLPILADADRRLMDAIEAELL